MTLVAVPIEVEDPRDVATALEQAQQAKSGGADLVEFRIDVLVEHAEGVTAARRLVQESPLPVLLTCRSDAEGGAWRGEETDRVSFLEAVGTAEVAPQFLDFEEAAWSRSANIRQKVRLVVNHPQQVRPDRARLVLSKHDFDGRPQDLTSRTASMAVDADVVKVAWTARSLRDCLEAFELPGLLGVPTVALCMGPFGLPSRVLAPKFGGFLTFAALDADSATAPGQPTLSQLMDLYRFRSIDTNTEVYGVAGWPVEHSKSPAFHNQAFAEQQRNAVYLPLPIAPDATAFVATLDAWLAHPGLDLRGLSVTLPHKETLASFVAERGGICDEATRLSGAANTLQVDASGQLHAFNTDVTAIEEALSERVNLQGQSALVLGAGGVARAATAALLRLGATVRVMNRTAARAEALAASFEGPVEVVTEPGSVAAVVQCTSVGMSTGPDPKGCPVDPAMLPNNAVLLETVYEPAFTPLREAFSQAGGLSIGGLEMFRRQAAAQCRLWTGQEPGAEALAVLDDS